MGNKADLKKLQKHWNKILAMNGFHDHEMGNYLIPERRIQRKREKQKKELSNEMECLIYVPLNDDMIHISNIKIRRSQLRQVLHLHAKKTSISQIMRETTLSRYKVNRIIKHFDEISKTSLLDLIFPDFEK